MRTSKSKDFDAQDDARNEGDISFTRTSARTHRGASRTQRTAAATTRMSKPLLTLATAMLVLTLIVSSAWIFNSAGVFAAGTDAVTASSLTNNNIGKHPLHALLSWDATGENLQNGGRFNWGAAVTGDYVDVDSSTGKVTSGDSSDEITPKFIKTAVNSTLKDDGGDTILEQSPIFTYKRDTKRVNGEEYSIYVDTNGNAVYFDTIAQGIALKYGFREGKELVFNINDEGTAARVWADAVLFTQHIGPAENIPFVSNLDYDRYRDTGLIPDTTMYAFAEGDYIFRTQLTPEEIEAGSVVYNAAADAYGVWEKYNEAEPKDGNAEYVQNGGKVQRYAHFFVNDNGSYYYDKVLKTMVRDTTSDTDNVEQYGGHKVKYSYYVPNFDGKTGLTKSEAEGGTLNVHGPVYRGNYFIENDRYEGWGTTGAYGGAKLMGQYITVRLNCDWTAKEITTDIYTVEGKTTTFDFVKTGEDTNAYKAENDAYVGKKKSEDVKIKYFTESTSGGYTLFYDASSIPFGTGNTPFTPYNELCAFSNGRINVPVGSYIVLDLNGHKIDRALSAEKYDDTAENSAYQYFGSVFSVNEFARLEVYDGTAFENASDTHISGANKNEPSKNYGTNGGLTTDQVGTITGGYVTHQFTKDKGNGRKVTEGSADKDIGDSNYDKKLSKLDIDDGVTRDSFTSAIADTNQAKGAAIHLFSHSDFVLHSGTISGNNAASQYGGAVYLLTNSSMTMFDGYIINNEAYRIGGGIYLADVSASVLTMYNGVIGYNYGGAGQLTLEKSNDLRENVLKRFRAIENYGGGIALRTKAYCNLYGGELVGNYSYGPGAGMYIESTAVGTLAGVTIKNNHTYGSPGGQGGSFAPYGGGGGVFVGGTGARIGFRGALQIVDNYKDNVINKDSTGDWKGTGDYTTNITYVPSNAPDNLHLPMQEMTTSTEPSNTTTNDTSDGKNNGKNENGNGDGSPASKNYDVDWNSNASIVISGPLIEKGIVANIGITMQAANAPFNSGQDLVFTQQYSFKESLSENTTHNDIAAHYFFTSDNPNYSVQMNGNEGMLKNNKATETQLTWVVEGMGIDADTKEVGGAPALSTLRVIVKPDGTLEYWYKNPNRSGSGDFKDTLAQVTASTKIESAEVELSNKNKTQDLLKILNDSFVATSGSLDFEYSMLNVTKVAVYSDTPDFTATGTIQSPLASWEVTNTGDLFGISSTFYTANFRFKLGEEDLEFKNTAEEDGANATVSDDSRMFKAIKATDESISYAGLYSFLYQAKTATRYANPTFKINIKQVGIEATRTCYFNGGDVTKRDPVPWQEDANFEWEIGEDQTKRKEPNAPYFLYRGDYYYPVLSADYNNPIKGSDLVTQYASQGGLEGYIRPRLTESVFDNNADYIRVVDPEKSGDCLFMQRDSFSGYVLEFRYSNQYFGKDNDNQKRDVHFGAHDGGGVEYKTLHKKPGTTVVEGQYVDGVKHAGTYLVTFVASSNGLANDTGVYFASNNFAFNAEIRLQVKPANAEVQLTDNARNNLTYFGTEYEDRQIAEFDNTSDTKVIPVNDDAVIFRYFLYDDEEIWKDNKKPSLEDLQKDVLAEDFQLKGDVTAQNYKEDGTPNTIPGTQVDPLNARTYIVVVTLELDMNYEEYDYVFTKDPAHLVNIDVIPEKQSNVWAYWFTIDPAEVDPYELIAGSSGSSDGNNTSVTITKDEYFKNVSYAYEYKYGETTQFPDGKSKFATTANLPTIKFGNTELALDDGETFGDYTVEYTSFAEKQDTENKQFNYVDASVGLDKDSSAPEVDGFKFGDYNLAVKITFGGRNKNYVNKKFTTGSADEKGTAYEDEKGAFYVYFRIVPIIVTARASMSYTYDGGSYDRGRYLPPRDGHGPDDAWYESIFFLAQDSQTISSELLSKQHDTYNDTNKSYLDEIWGGIQGVREADGKTYSDTVFYQSRYTIADVNVYYTNNEFIDHDIRLGVGMYAFQTGDENYNQSSYYLNTLSFDGVQDVEQAPKEKGVMWLLTVGNVQTHASTNTGKTDATNFIIDSQSQLNVKIEQRNITNNVKAYFNNSKEEYKNEELSFPYAGKEYNPPIELKYTVQVPTNAYGPHKTSEITLAKFPATAESKDKYDYYVTYSNTLVVSTESSPAKVILTAADNNDDKFSNNYNGTLTINFKIVPAKIKVTRTNKQNFTYDRDEHEVEIAFENASEYDDKINEILKLDGAPSFSAPIPNSLSDISIRYATTDGTGKAPEGANQKDWPSTPRTDAGNYRVAVYTTSANFTFESTAEFNVFGEDSRSVVSIYQNTDLVIDPATVYVGDLTHDFVYNRNIQVPQLSATDLFRVKHDGTWIKDESSNVIPSGNMGEYKLSYTNAATVDKDSEYTSTDSIVEEYKNAGGYWLVVDLTSENFIWGGYEGSAQIDDQLFPHTEFEGNKRLAIKYTVAPSEVVLKPEGAAVGEDGSIHITYDRNKKNVNVSVFSDNMTPLLSEYVIGSVTGGDSISAGTYSFTVTFEEKASKNFKWNENQEAWNTYNENKPIDWKNDKPNAAVHVKDKDGGGLEVSISYTIDPSKVVLKPNGATVDEKGEIHFTYDGVEHTVGVVFYTDYTMPNSGDYTVAPPQFDGESFTNGKERTNVGKYTISITLNSANFVWDDDKTTWTEQNSESSVDWIGESYTQRALHIKKDVGATTVTITYTIDPATVEIDSVTSEQFNRQAHGTPQINFKNTDPASSVIPTSFEYTKFDTSKTQWLFKPYDATIPDSTEKTSNASLSDGHPFNAGNYDVTITLTRDDAHNFKLQQKGQYTHSFNDGEKTEDKTVDYTDDGNPITAVALFVIEQLGVYANQVVSSVIFDNKDHFMGDPYGLTERGRYGGNGPWTIGFSPSGGATSLDGISYNIRYTGNDKDGQEYTVTVKIGGYSTDGRQSLLADNFYLKAKEQDNATSSNFTAIQEKGFFTNAHTYTYTLYFEDANFFISTGGGKATEQELTFTINPAQIALGTLDHGTFNNKEQEAPFKEGSFTKVGDTTLEDSEIWTLLKTGGYNVTSYVAAAESNAQLGNTKKPFNAGTYTVTVTLKNSNFTFSGSEPSSTTSFIIDPFDISSLDTEQFKATLPDVKYTGMAMKTYIKEATLTIDGNSITLVLLTKDASEGKLLLGDNGYELTISRYNNNINVKRRTDGDMTAIEDAEAYIAGSGNFSGEIMRKFTIQPRDVNVHIESSKENIYGVSLGGSEANTPSNLGKQKGVDWNIIPDEAAGGEGELSATRINELIEESIFASYGTANQEAINKAIEAFEKFNGSDAMKFMYDGDNLAVSLSIADGKYNTSDFVYKDGCALLVGEYQIAGYKGNDNYNVIFSGDYNTEKRLETPETAKYGYYQVVQREISITPADNSIVYGNAKHTYNNNEAGDTYLTWTATFDYDLTAILEADLEAVTKGVTLTIVGSDDYEGSKWLPVGTYKIEVSADTIGKLDDGANATEVTQCYKVKGIGTWTNDPVGIAIEAVTIGTGGTYTVTARDITLKITPNVLKYEYNHAEPNAERDILKYMLEKFATKFSEEGVEARYGHIFTAEKGANINDEENWYAEGEGFESLKLKLIKDEGVGANTYSVSPSWDNPNYNVTFEGTSNSVTITPRKIIVHINDQKSVYGDDVIVGTTEGKSAAEIGTANWYAMLSEDSESEDWTDDLNSDLNERIKKGRLGEDDLDINFTKEFGANVGKYYLKGSFSNNNYLVTFEGEWTQASSTTEARDGDPDNGTAGIYEITVRPVTVTVLGQSGVYGGNQHTSIGSTENTHWRAETGTVGSGEGVVNNDSLGISITIISEGKATSKAGQLNVGWYSVRVSYSNPNYNVTFVGDNSGLETAQYVKEYETHSTSKVTNHMEGDAVTAYDVSNAYYIYARIISITVLPQSFTYSGNAPTLKPGKDWWSANNVINGDMPAILSGDQTDFENAIVLELVAPTDGDDMYNVWKQWGMWSAGRYEGKSGIKATLDRQTVKTEGVDESIFTNYELSTGESSVLGVLRINPAEITVTHNGQESTYNNKAPSVLQDEENYTITGTVYSSRKWIEEESKFEDADKATSDKGLLEFTFTFDGDDYGAGRHFILGNWTYPAVDAHNPNYNVTFNTGTYTINKRKLQVTIKDQYVIYGETLWNGDDWWLETPDGHGAKTPNEKYWSISVINPNTDDNDVYWINETDRNALDIAPDSKAQQSAGKYQIAGRYNNSDDYVVTFFGSWNASNPEKTNGTGGTYTVYKRAIKVHINDQSGVYGSFSGDAPVDQSDWTVVGFDSTKQQGICEEHECGEPTIPFVGESDNLNISLKLDGLSTATPGNYKIIGTCNNQNYEVTWVGGNEESEGKYERDHGIFGLTKRQVTVTVQNQSIEYGKLTNGETTGFKAGTTDDGRASGYTASADNDSVNLNAFIATDKVKVVLSVAVDFDKTSNYNKAGKYAITIKIYEGYNSPSEMGTLIYSSLISEQSNVTPSDKYELSVAGDYTDADFGSKDEINGKTGAYEITKKDLIITVAGKSSVYGEKLEDLTFTINGAMADDESEIKEHVKLDIADKKFNDWDRETQTYLCAGSYHITATLDDATINNNYSVVFRTQNGADYKTDVEGEKITAMYTVTKRMLAINITYLNSRYGEELAGFEATLSPVGDLTGDPILKDDRTSGGSPLGIEFEIVGSMESYNLSSAGKLKAGIYPILGRWNNNENYDISFMGVWTTDNTETWLTQATQNSNLYQDVEGGEHATLDRKAGVYTVSQRPINVTLGTKNPSSEYGDPIEGLDTDDFHNTEKSWGYTYEGRVGEDIIAFEMTTDARQGNGAKTYDITPVVGSYVAKDGNDNANYSITFKNGTYTIKPREMNVSLTAKDPKVEEDGYSCATDVYGTTYDQEAKFAYTFSRTNPKGDDNSFYNGETIKLVITPWRNAGAGKAELTSTGYYPVGTYSLELSADANSNYIFTKLSGSNVRYKVTPRPITIHVNDQHSVFGETINVDETQGNDANSGGWYVKDGNIIEGNGHTDDLGIRISKNDADINFREGGYELTASASNGNYAVTFEGNWKDGHNGIYNIKKRTILIRIHNQYSIYGENVRVSSETSAWTWVDPKDIEGGKGTYFTLLDGQTPGITLNLYTQAEDGTKTWYGREGFESIIPRGEYRIGVENISNDNYAVVVEENYLPDINDTEGRKHLCDDFDDFGKPTSKDTIEVVKPVISEELAKSPNAMYFVTIRPITIRIYNQSGTYGDFLTLNSAMGREEAYNIELGANTTNTPFIGDYRATFDLVTTAFEDSDITGEHPVGVNEGWSLDAGTYPIFGAEYHVYIGDRLIENPTEATELSHNYQFNFIGSYQGKETYKSGTTFYERAGVYTVVPRQVSLTAKDSSATYGGTDTVVLVPTPDNGNYQAIVSNSKTSEHNDEKHGAILDKDLDSIAIKIEIEDVDANLSRAKALKVGQYTLKLTYKENKNYEITAINGKFDVISRQASISIKPSAATATYLAAVSEKWDQSSEEMFTSANVLSGDIIAFTMTTEAKQGNAVGYYKLIGKIGDPDEGNDNENYTITFTDGTFEITKKSVDVTIKDQKSEYGEKVNVNDKSGWELPDDWNKDPDTVYTNSSDTVDALGIKLSTSADEYTDAGRYQILGQYAVNGEVGKNYDLHFVGSWNASEGMTNGNGGTLTITPRAIVVVIKPQAITYRDDITIDQHGWYAWRGNNTATWTPDGGTNNDYGVLGPKDTLEALRVNLVKGNATDTATYGENTGSGTYVGTYALVASNTASNYSITFAYERETKEAYNYSSVEKDEDGTFTIKPYDITINIRNLGDEDNSVEYGGTTYVKNGGKLYFGAELVNDEGVTWEYVPEEGKNFLPTELGYLSFRLGGDYNSETYAFVGSHPIVGYWGYGLDNKNATDYRMKFNYNVTFKGEWNNYINTTNKAYGYDALYENKDKTADGTCGVIQISEAEVEKKSYDQSYDEGKNNGNWHGDNWNRETAFSGNKPDNPWHSMAVGEKDLLFAGNVAFGGNSVSFDGHENSKLAEKVVVTYRNLQHDGTPKAWADEGKAPEEQEVGKWTVEVTVKAPYHKEKTFTLTLTITRIDITIYLNNKEIVIPYGEYKLNDNVVVPADPKGTSLNNLLKSKLFAPFATNEYLDKTRVGGAITSGGVEEAGAIENIVAYLLDNADVQVSISTRTTDASTGGYLTVQSYLLTIQAGDNMSIKFGADYNNVVVTKRQLKADWKPSYEASEQRTNADGRPEYVYKFEHRAVSVVPHVELSGILWMDKVLLNNDNQSVFGYRIYKKGADGTWERVDGNEVYDVGTYKFEIIENLTPTPEKNVDIGNYTTPVGEYVYIVIEPATLTIVIEDQTSEYGDIFTLDTTKWYIKTSDIPGAAHPEVVPGTGEALSALGIILSFHGDAPVNAGTYAIFGRATSTNYDIKFEGSFGATEDRKGVSGTYTITQRNVLIKVKSFSFVYGANIHENLADDSNQYQAVHMVDGGERPDEIAVLPSDNIDLKISVKHPAMTATGYLKAGTYDVVCSYENANYNVTFADAEGHPEGAGSYNVKVNVAKKRLTITIHGRQVNYGDMRPAMPENYNITGLAQEDKSHYESIGLDRPDFIVFDIFEAETAKPLQEFGSDVEDKFKFDPVGVYIIIGKSTVTDTPDDIGDNYDVEFAGEWAATGKYTSDEYVGKAGKYEVVPRTLSIVIGNVQSEYGDIIPDEEIPFTRLEGPGNMLAGNDTDADLHVTFVTEAIKSVDGKVRTNDVGTYPITRAISGNKNYVIDGYIQGTYKIVPREISLEMFDMTHPYGDDHLAYLAAATLDKGWTAHRVGEGKEGNGIAYPDTDAIVGQIKLVVNGLSDRSGVNDYTLSYTQNGSDDNYSIKSNTDAQYHVVPRKVQLTIKGQKNEYGENHALSSDAAYYEFTLLETNSNKTEAVVFSNDNVVTGLKLVFVDEINARTSAGRYRIDAEFTDPNYDVKIAGEFIEGERQYGTYTIAPRDIVITLLGTQQSEYGDEVVASAEYGVGWTVDRPEGRSGNALVNDDKISLELTVLDNRGMAVDSTFSVGEYAVIVKSADISSNYNVKYEAAEGGRYGGSVSGHSEVAAVYTIVPRNIVVEFGGESEYGDPINVLDRSYRADGKEGPALVNGDKLGFDWEWGAQGDPTNGGQKLADKGYYALRLKDQATSGTEQVRKNYKITASENSFYEVVARKVTVHVRDIVKTYGEAFEDPNEIKEELLEVTRATEGAKGDAILNNDIQFLTLSVINGDNILLTDGKPVNAGVYNYKLVYTDNNSNYEISVEYGHYTIVPKPVTVTIDSKTSKYSEDILALTHGEVKGLIGDDELYIVLSVLWGDEDRDLKWHNAGVYAIEGVWDNPNYAVTFKGDLGEHGKYTIEKADNLFTKEYDGNGTVYMGDNFRDGDLPTALWGNDSLRLEFYLDDAMTHKADFADILDAEAGTYYVKVIVDEADNWKGTVTSFTLNVVDALSFSDGMDVTAYVCIFMSQFIILACALIFIKRKKDKKNKNI